jgi:uncharacterized protein (TIGR00288 family)
LAERESSLAVLVDFENMARPGAKGRGDFDIHLVNNRLAEKGRVLVKRAYADWSRYRDARHELQNAGLGLIEMPSAREGAKNRADIQMAVDAMELAYSREHVDTFVIVSGDSDFTPLVGKLRELNKRVIGVGNRESASELLIANCDEFIFYDLLAAQAAGSTPRRSGGSGLNPMQLLQETLTALQREGTEWPLASVVKDSMRRKYPAFDESEHGFSTFSKFLEEAATAGIVRIETDPRSGTYRVELAGGAAAPLSQAAAGAPAAERAGDEGDGRRRRRRGGRRPDPATTEAVAGDDADLDGDAEVFEVVITPTPDVDLGTLPPLDEPISYEDMIMLGPEVGEDVPDLAEATDVATDGEPPSRSSRRRRRRAASDPEPTVADLEPLDPSEVAEAVVSEEPVVLEEAVAEPVAEDDEGAPRRRRRRRVSAAEDEAPAEAPVEPAVAAPEPPPAEEEPPAGPGRRRVRRRATVAAEAEAAVEAAPSAETGDEEATKPKRRTRKAAPKAEAVADVEAGADEAPKPKRRTRKAAPKAEAVADVEVGADEAPKPKRRTRRAAPKAEPVGTGSETS